ncbi:MAG: hypothetical protein M1302_02875 [Candidatus Thermoplasmatota archaeon]|nr:hypothetical protein [Candidatus Thermoplasmatota archaeon]
MTSDISKVIADLAGKVKVYPLQNSIMATFNQILIWKGDDPSKFVETMISENVPILYHYISPVSLGTDSQAPAEHEEIAFLVNGFVHLFIRSTVTPAAKPASSSERSQGLSQSQGAIPDRSPEEVAVDMTNFVSMSLDYMSPDTFNLQYFFKKYWLSQGLNPDIPAGSALKKFMDKVEEISTKKIKSRS